MGLKHNNSNGEIVLAKKTQPYQKIQNIVKNCI